MGGKGGMKREGGKREGEGRVEWEGRRGKGGRKERRGGESGMGGEEREGREGGEKGREEWNGRGGEGREGGRREGEGRVGWEGREGGEERRGGEGREGEEYANILSYWSSEHLACTIPTETNVNFNLSQPERPFQFLGVAEESFLLDPQTCYGADVLDRLHCNLSTLLHPFLVLLRLSDNEPVLMKTRIM